MITDDQNDSPDEAQELEPKQKKGKKRETACHNKCESKEFLRALTDRIKEKYPHKGRIAPIYLFTSDGIHRFRVNWWLESGRWAENQVTFSAFIKVCEGEEDIEIFGDERELQEVSDPYLGEKL